LFTEALLAFKLTEVLFKKWETGTLICMYDENEGWFWYGLNALERKYSRGKVKRFKCSMERRVNSDFLVWFIFPKYLL